MNTSKFIQAIHSRTVWTLVVMIVYNVLDVYGKGLDPQMSTLVNLILGALVSYFHVNPQMVYTPAGTPPVPPVTPVDPVTPTL